jgi:hypothetical protein
MFQTQYWTLPSANFKTYQVRTTHNATLNLWATHVTSTSTAYHSFATTVSQLKMCDSSGETFKGFEVL